jgi:hypothetical protein
MEKAERQEGNGAEEFVFFNTRVPLSFVKKVKVYLAKYFEVNGKRMTVSDLVVNAISEYIKNHPIEGGKDEQ